MNFEESWPLACESIGSGPDVVFVHGAMTPGVAAFPAQRSLASDFRLHFPHRRGYSPNPPVSREDFERDAYEFAQSLARPAHLIGHSYGSLVVMHAAASRPSAVLSMTLIEPVLFSAAVDDPTVTELVGELRALFEDTRLSLRDFVVSFGAAVGLDLTRLPEIEGSLLRHAELLRGQRPPWEGDSSVLEPLRSVSAPKLVVNGGSSDGMRVLGQIVAAQIGANHATLKGHGHDVQRAGEWLNPLLTAHFAHGVC
jgi:pimeloyl-ACP methyl ester carboxylesterase